MRADSDVRQLQQTNLFCQRDSTEQIIILVIKINNVCESVSNFKAFLRFGSYFKQLPVTQQKMDDVNGRQLPEDGWKNLSLNNLTCA
ncbi:hypothetical protein PO909_026826 [Leuciscus waleckii]